MRLKTTFIAALGAFFLSPLAIAGTVLWTASGITFNESGSGGITGSFDFDADTSTFSNVSLVSGGSTFTTEEYYSSANNVIGFVTTLGTGNGDPYLQLDLNSLAPLTDSGGTVAVSFSELATCASNNCANVTSGSSGDTGSVIGTSVTSAAPEPASLALTSSGMLALLGLALRRRK